MTSRFCAVLVLLLFAALASAEKHSGSLTPTSFHYLSKFAFDYDAGGDFSGLAVFHLHANPASLGHLGALEVLAYSDEADSWPAVWKKPLTCSQKSAQAKGNSWGEVFFDPTGYAKVEIHIRQRLRPRYWFFAVARCNDEGKLPEPASFSWELRMLNTRQSEWSHELGVNVYGFNSMYLAFFALSLLFCLAHGNSLRIYRSRFQFVHPLVRIYTFVLVVMLLGIAFRMAHWLLFAQNGAGQWNLDQLGASLLILAKAGLVFFMLLIAKGWTISHDTINKMSRVWILGITALFVTFELAVSIYAFTERDRAEVEIPKTLTGLYIAQTLVWFLLGAYFAAILIKTWIREKISERKFLYTWLGLIFAFWFVMNPVAWLLDEVVSPWVREKWVEGLRLSTTVAVVFLLGVMLRPSAADKWFKVGNPHANGATQAYRELDLQL